MKKFAFVLTVLTAVCTTLFACGVQKKFTVLKESDTYIVISEIDDFAGKPLLEAMQAAKDKGELDYTIEGSMVTSMNGVENAADYSSCWMIYTDDENFSNTAWGEIEYDGKTCGSASKGVSELIVASGKIYVFVYTEF